MILTRNEVELLIDSMNMEIACELSDYETTQVNGHLLEIKEVRAHDGRTGEYYVDGQKLSYKEVLDVLGGEQTPLLKP